MHQLLVTRRLTAEYGRCSALSTEQFTGRDAGPRGRETRPVEFERALSAAGELLLGAACHGCSEPWWGICPRCRAAALSYGCFATRPDPCPAGFPFTVSTAPYDAILRQLVTAHKERGALNLTPFLAGRWRLRSRAFFTSRPARRAPWCWFRCPPRVPPCESEGSTRPGLWRGGRLGCFDARCRSVPAGCCIRRVRYAIRRGSALSSEPPIFRALFASPGWHLVRRWSWSMTW
jgi:hypothetical protein